MVRNGMEEPSARKKRQAASSQFDRAHPISENALFDHRKGEMTLPHVTEVLRPWMNFEWVPEEALERGRKRHAAFAAYLLGAWAPAVDPRDEGQVESFKRWADKYVQKVLAVEKYLEEKELGFAGTIDAILETTQYPGAVFDFKPPGALNPVYEVQLATYEHLARRNGYFVLWAGFLRPDLDGGIARVDWMKEKVPDTRLPVFLSALNCHRFFKGG